MVVSKCVWRRCGWVLYKHTVVPLYIISKVVWLVHDYIVRYKYGLGLVSSRLAFGT